MSSSVTREVKTASFQSLEDDGFIVQSPRRGRGRREAKSAATHLDKVSHVRARAYALPAAAPAPRAAPPSFSMRGPGGISTSRAILVPGSAPVAAPRAATPARPRSATAKMRTAARGAFAPPTNTPAPAAPATPRPSTAPAVMTRGPDGGEIRRVNEVAIQNFKFSQLSIGATTSTGMTLQELQEVIDKEGWDETQAPLQGIENEDGTITAIDNRRTYALKKILEGNPTKTLNIPVEVFKRFDPIDKKMLRRLSSYGNKVTNPQVLRWREEIKNLLIKKGHVKLNTMSEGLVNRMFAEAYDPTKVLPKDYCGFTDFPRVRGGWCGGRTSPVFSPRPLRGRAMEVASWRE